MPADFPKLLISLLSLWLNQQLQNTNQQVQGSNRSRELISSSFTQKHRESGAGEQGTQELHCESVLVSVTDFAVKMYWTNIYIFDLSHLFWLNLKGYSAMQDMQMANIEASLTQFTCKHKCLSTLIVNGSYLKLIWLLINLLIWTNKKWSYTLFDHMRPLHRTRI